MIEPTQTIKVVACFCLTIRTKNSLTLLIKVFLRVRNVQLIFVLGFTVILFNYFSLDNKGPIIAIICEIHIINRTYSRYY